MKYSELETLKVSTPVDVHCGFGWFSGNVKEVDLERKRIICIIKTKKGKEITVNRRPSDVKIKGE